MECKAMCQADTCHESNQRLGRSGTGLCSRDVKNVRQKKRLTTIEYRSWWMKTGKTATAKKIIACPHTSRMRKRKRKRKSKKYADEPALRKTPCRALADLQSVEISHCC